MKILQAGAIAPAARAWLAGAPAARILNIFDRALNLIDGTGNVLSIVTHERGMTPFGLSLRPAAALPFQALTVSSFVHVQADAIGVGDLHVDCRGAVDWYPRPDWEMVRTTLASEPARLGELSSAILERFSAGPAASLLELYLAPTPIGLPVSLYERVRAGAADLVAGFIHADGARVSSGASQLAGVGGGLTPAGDDFAVGVCLRAWAGLYGDAGTGLCGAVVEAMAARTTSLSAAYLHAAARGECAAPWHALFDALLEPAATARRAALAAAVAALFAIGHTSGADGLAGFMAYNQSIFRRTHENPD